jgi:hypothetical protein
MDRTHKRYEAHKTPHKTHRAARAGPRGGVSRPCKGRSNLCDVTGAT